MPELPTCVCVGGLPPFDRLSAIYCALAEDALDPDATDFFSRTGSLTTSAYTDQQARDAINTLVLELKAEGLWDGSVGIYPMVGATALSQSQNLRADANNITWSGGLTHDANGVTGNGTTGYGDLGSTGNFITINSGIGMVYCRTATPVSGGRFFGAVSTTGSTRRFDLVQNAGGLGGSMNDDTFKGLVVPNFQSTLSMSRTAAAAGSIGRNGATFSSWADAAVGVPTTNLLLLARSFEGFANDSFSNANLAFATFGAGLTTAQITTYYNAIQTFQTALGRAV